jgi:hypothetical protein
MDHDGWNMQGYERGLALDWQKSSVYFRDKSYTDLN